MYADSLQLPGIEDYYCPSARKRYRVAKLPNEDFRSAPLQLPMETCRCRVPKGILMMTSPVLVRTRISPPPRFVFSRA